MISLGIDIGGTGAKCAAFREDGSQAAIAYLEYPNPPGKTDLDAGILWDCVMRVIAKCTAAIEDKGEIRVITVSSFGESFVPVDREGNPLTDIIMYFADSNSSAFDRLVAQVGEERFMRIAKIKPDAGYSLAKMLYTLEQHGASVWKFLLIAGFVCYKLTGITAADVSLSCRTLLYDVEKRCWSRELLEAAGIDEALLPEVYETGSIIGPLKPELAGETGLPEGVQVVIGAHDQIVNALACGIARPGEAMDGTGTTECIEPLFAAIPQDIRFARENFACVPYPDGRGYVTYAYNISGGSVVRWYRDRLAAYLKAQAEEEGVSIYDLLNRVCPAEPTDLTVLPFLMGMGGTPDISTGAKGMIYGLTMETGLPEIYRAMLEGLSFEMLYNLEAMEKYGMAPEKLYACGGGARSEVWLQIKADVWNREIIPVRTEETGALGSAILGFAAILGEKDRCEYAKRFVRTGDPVRPDPRRAAIYREKYALYKKLRSFMLNDIIG